MISIQSKYDCVILGDHPAALLSGCLAARQGLSVLYVKLKEQSPTRVKTENGFVLDFESKHSVGVSKESLFFDLLKYCGLDEASWKEYVSEFTGYDLFLDHQRIPVGFHAKFEDVYIRSRYWTESEEEDLFLYFYQSFHRDFLKFWKKYPILASSISYQKKHSWFNPEEFKSYLKKKVDPKYRKRLQKFLNSELYLTHWTKAFLQSFSLHSKNSFRSLTGYELLEKIALSQTSGLFRDGQTKLREELFLLAKNLGSREVHHTFVKKIEVLEQGSFLFEFEGADEKVESESVISGVPLEYAKAYLYKKGAKKSLSSVRSQKPIGWTYVMSVAMSESISGEDIVPRCFVSGSSLQGLEIEIDGKFVFLRTDLPWSPESLDRESLKKLSVKMLGAFYEAMPGWKYASKRVFPNCLYQEEDSFEKDFVSLYPFENLEDIPMSLRVYPSLKKTNQSDLRNLFLCNQEMYSEFGLLGTFLSSLESVSVLSHQLGGEGAVLTKDLETSISGKESS